MAVCREPIRTRSMTRFQQGELIRDVLSVPGIMTNIADQFESNDYTLLSLYFCLNNERVRFELEPYVSYFKNEFDKREQKHHIRCMQHSIKKHLSECTNASTRTYRAMKIIELYEYLISMIHFLPLLGKGLANTMQTKLTELKSQYTKPWFINQLEQIEHQLQDYFHWYRIVRDDPSVPWYLFD